MTKQETYDYLRAHGVDFEITEHKAVFNMEECADLHLPYPESEAKNLFIRVDFFLDRDFLLPPDRIGVHPNDNTATIWLSAQALVNVLKENGTTVEITEC